MQLSDFEVLIGYLITHMLQLMLNYLVEAVIPAGIAGLVRARSESRLHGRLEACHPWRWIPASRRV